LIFSERLLRELPREQDSVGVVLVGAMKDGCYICGKGDCDGKKALVVNNMESASRI